MSNFDHGMKTCFNIWDSEISDCRLQGLTTAINYTEQQSWALNGTVVNTSESQPNSVHLSVLICTGDP